MVAISLSASSHLLASGSPPLFTRVQLFNSLILRAAGAARLRGFLLVHWKVVGFQAGSKCCIRSPLKFFKIKSRTVGALLVMTLTPPPPLSDGPLPFPNGISIRVSPV
jgi:hypothetical protein